MVLTVGLVLIFVGVGFKLAVVPFHMWTPDVYQGAPAPVTAYIATVSKGGGVRAAPALLAPLSSDTASTLFLVLAAVAIASMLAGNLLALRQDNVKRILAYSSIAHLGYLLVAFLARAAGRGGRGLLPRRVLRHHAGRLRRGDGALAGERDAGPHARLPRARRAAAVAGRRSSPSRCSRSPACR